jgi:hypothetical protein
MTKLDAIFRIFITFNMKKNNNNNNENTKTIKRQQQQQQHEQKITQKYK